MAAWAQVNNQPKCTNRACSNISACKLKDKHPELQNEISSLQKDLKEQQ